MSDRKFKQVGTRPIRHDGLEKVTGRANFGADYSLPGMLQGAVLRSPHAHATIVSIDASPAFEVDGVKAVITGRDFPVPTRDGDRPLYNDVPDLSNSILARDKVLYHGHPVAAVAATTTRPRERHGARRANPARRPRVPGPAPTAEQPHQRRAAHAVFGRRCRAGLRGFRSGGRARIHDANGPPGLHRAACGRGRRPRERQGHDLVLHPGTLRRAHGDLGGSRDRGLEVSSRWPSRCRAAPGAP